ncbi:MAG: hypothetical protein AAB383_04585 [Patescibacteria group bacterium]
MLIHGFNSHYRETQKKLFLGASILVFANPGNDGTADQASQGPEAPRPNSGGADAPGESEFYKEMKKWVPERTEYVPGEHQDVMDDWLSQLGSVNMVQIEIDKLIRLKTQLKSPKYLQDKPLLKDKIVGAYREMLAGRQQIERLQGMNIGQDIDWGNLQRKTSADYQARTSEVLTDIDYVIQKLVDKRSDALRVTRELMIEDFQRRLIAFQVEWEADPPPGYESAAADWIHAAEQIMDESERLERFDSRNPAFPEGSRVFEKARNMWEGIRNMETTLDLYREGQSHGLNPAKLAQELQRIEALRTTKITDEVVARNRQKIDEVLSRIEAIKPQIEGADPEVVKEIEKLKEHLIKNRDLNAVIDDVLNSTEAASEGKEYGGVKHVLTKGLKGQLDFISKVPVSETERNHMMFRFSDALKALEGQINGAEKSIETVYPDILKKIALVEEEQASQGKKKKGYKIYWLAPGPTFGIVSHAIQDVFKKNYDRDTQRKAGIWGSKAFEFLKKLPTPIFEEQLRPLKEIAGKMAIEQEHAETNDYQEWMKNHDHAPVSHLIHVMHDTTNQFEFRAVIELLAKKGRMRFDDEGFLLQLNRWQSTYPIPASRHWHQSNNARSEDLIKKGVNLLYGDIDLYQNWRTSNSSAIESEKGKFSSRFAEVSEKTGGLESEIKPILAEYLKDLEDPSKHGGSDADPVKYEAVLLYAIKEGKMDAEDVLYYLIQGIGKGLLPLERGSVFTGLNNNYPAIEIFASPTKRGQKPVLEDVQEWSEMNKEEYMDWFHSHVMYLPKVRQRLVKAQSQGMRLDHDYFTAFAGYLNSSTVKRLLQANNEGYGLQETAVQNGTVGMLFTLDTLAESYDEFTDDTGQKALSNVVETIMTFDGITSGRIYANQGNYYRMSNATREAEPRAAGGYGLYYGRGKMSTGAHLKTMKQHLHLLDFDSNFPMIRKLINNEFKNDTEAATFAQNMLAAYPGIFAENPLPTTVDKLYENIGVYIDYAIKNGKPSIRNYLNTMKAEHTANIAAMKAAAIASGESKETIDKMKSAHARREEREGKMKHFRQEFAKKMEGGKLVEDHHGHAHHDDHGAHGSHGAHGGHGDAHAEGHTPTEGGPSSHGSTHGGGH